MQIVIDKENLITMFAVALYAISGGSYDTAKDTVTELLEEIGYTSLPKGHGRLIDGDRFDAISYQHTNDDFDNGVMWFAEQIDNAPTIIEADKAESEEV